MSEEAKMADPYAARECWTEIVRSAADRGKLDTIPVQPARTAREFDVARKQNYFITRRSYAIPCDLPFQRPRPPRVSPYAWDEEKGWVLGA